MLRRFAVAATVATGTVLVVALPASAADRGPWMMRDGGDHPYRAVRWLFLLLVVGAAVAITWLLARRNQTPPAVPPASPVPPVVPSPTTSAEAIIAERLARGEITADDYRSMLSALREPVGGPPPAAS